jgi:predicted P-loop ATPase
VTLDDFVTVGAAALQSLESLLANWLPAGVREGNEYCIGSRHGEAGRSMRIRLTGERAGFWSDFAGEGDAGADLISLYAFIHGVSQGKACAEIARELGIPLTESSGAPSAVGRPVKPGPKAIRKPQPAPADKGVEVPAAKPPRTPWEVQLPVPEKAGPFPKAHPVRGRPDAFWEYRDQGGQLLGVIYRFTTSDGGKEVLPCVYAKHPTTGACEWRWLSFPVPRPLYLHGPHRPDLPLLVVEGEKCADVAVSLLAEHFEGISWAGGGKAVDKTGWASVVNRDVVLWADADAKVYKEGHELAGQIKPEHEQPGMMTMNKLAAILTEQGCNVLLVDIPAPGEKPDGWDIADLVAEGATREEVLAWATKLRTPAAPAVADDATDDVPAWVGEQMGEQLDAASTAPPAGAGKASKSLRGQLIQTANGGVKGCRENVFTVMEGDPRLIGLVGLDLFSGLQVKRRSTPWPSEPGEWTESDDFRLGMYMSQHHNLLLAAIGDIERGVAQAAREHAFNPVLDYMNRCASMWDGVSRVPTALSTYWGCTDSEYLRLISTMFFTGIVLRAYRPGVKHDHAPVFEGGQGEGKSTALKVLGGDWFADTPFRMGEKDGYLSIQGVLLYEVAELEQFNRSEVTAIKAFMSSTTDRFREPYGRRMKNMPRRCAFAATTNEGEYFKDTTGNRRFWPVATGRISIDDLVRDRDQLFGEAVAMMNAGVLWYPTRDQQDRLISPEQENREIPDPWHGHIYDYLQGVDADGKPKLAGAVKRVTARELLTKALHFEISKLGPARLETMRISAIMRKLGWTKGRETAGARERFYTRPEGAEAAQTGEGEHAQPY